MAVVGAGPGGLAFAAAMARRGRSVVVFERASGDAPVGGGIQITPNGSSILKALGLAGRLEAIGSAASELEIWDYRGESRLAAFPLKPAVGDWPGPYLLARRQDLLAELRNLAVELGVDIRPGCRVRQIETMEDGAVCELADGVRRKFDFVVGADGLNSVVRTALNGHCEAKFSGHVAWRSSISKRDAGFEFSPRQVRIVLAPDRHAVMYSMRGGEALNVVAVEKRARWDGESARRDGDIKEFKKAFFDFGASSQEIFANCDPLEEWGLFERGVADVWWRGRAAIIGDALHPMMPFLGQGANAAFEDAWTLAAKLAEHESTGDALEGFRLERRDRIARVVARSKRQAWAYHLANPALRFAAHRSLRLANALYPGALSLSLHWLYGKDSTEAKI